MTLLVIINALVFVSLSLIHVYWAVGGKFGNLAVVPSHPDGSKLFKPGPLSTWVVAGGLMVFALITLGNLPSQYGAYQGFIRFGNWTIATIFILRSIGDFRFIGFFKKVKGTNFANNDTRIYSPLSLCIGLISLILANQSHL